MQLNMGENIQKVQICLFYITQYAAGSIVFDLSIFLHMRAYVLAKAFCERLAVDFKLCLYLILNISCLLALSYRVYSKYS